jgi:hypothetical protein
MKKFFKTMMISALIITGVALSVPSSAQAPTPPPTGGSGNGDQPIGGTAPIGGGILLLLVMGAGYGIKKVYSTKAEQ